MSKRTMDDKDAQEAVQGEENVDTALAPSLPSLVRSVGQKMFQAIRERSLEKLDDALSEGNGIGVYYEESESALSPLMLAADEHWLEGVKRLLEGGAPWNAVDSTGRTVGDYAIGDREIYHYLVNHAVQVELVVKAMEGHKEKVAQPNNYLAQKLKYEGECLLDEGRRAVMMGWEGPLMEEHAKRITKNGGHILNIGYGLGLVDAAIARHSIASHTVCEPHPDVLAEIERRKETLRVVPLTWQEALEKGVLRSPAEDGLFDGIFFDTWDEDYDAMGAFHEALPGLLREGGIYSFFNGLAAHYPFFHDVACLRAELELTDLGFAVDWEDMPVPEDALKATTWAPVAEGPAHYWRLERYRLPTCTFEGSVTVEVLSAKD